MKDVGAIGMLFGIGTALIEAILVLVALAFSLGVILSIM